MKKGTSMVELLAVIVILGIIALIAYPTVGALIKNIEKKACHQSIENIKSSYRTMSVERPSQDEGYEIIDSIMLENGYTLVDSSLHTYLGACKNDGVYTVIVDYEGYLEIICSVH